jgi:hypothetical protein
MHVPWKISVLFLSIYLILTGVISIFDIHPLSDDMLALLGCVVGALLLFDV